MADVYHDRAIAHIRHLPRNGRQLSDLPVEVWIHVLTKDRSHRVAFDKVRGVLLLLVELLQSLDLLIYFLLDV